MAVGKDTKYRGKTLEELKALDIREFARYVDSRARRTILRQDNIIQRFLKKCKKYGEFRIKNYVKKEIICIISLFLIIK